MLRSFNIEVAEQIIEINALFSRMYNISRDYITTKKEKPIISLQCTIQDYDKAAAKYEAEYKRMAPCDVYLEEYALLEMVSDILIEYNTLLMHGAAVCYGDGAFLFTGKSCVGKTTHALKWTENLADAYIINGDKPYIRIFEDKESPMIYGSPWRGKEGYGINTKSPLKAIVYLIQSENNMIRQVPISEAFSFLYQQVYRPSSVEKMRKTLRLIKLLDEKVGFYVFNVNNFKDDCFQTVYNTLLGGIREE